MPNVYAVNRTSYTIPVNSWYIYYINNSNAELVTVYNTNNNPYDCFKYVLNNNPWFYVLDSVQNSWVNDLSVIGYSLTPPAPTLPTVTYLSTVYGLTSTASIASGYASSPLKSSVGGVYDGDYFTKDNSKQYAFFRYNDGVGYKNAGGIFEVAWSQDNYLCAKNVTDGTEDLESVRIAECSNADAQVVTVYDIEYGDASYAFKFDLSGTYYYSILDSGLHPGEWTDDLAAAGYTEDSPEPPVVLPTVEKFSDAYPTTSSARGSYAAGDSGYLYEHSPVTRAMPYDNSKVYSVYGYYVDSGWKRGRFFDTQNDGGIVKIVNITSSTISGIYLFLYATCSSNQATVVPVYNASNVAYNAFKYTANGTDYYYVLDGTQTDWTDDLAGIGYWLPEIDVDVNYGDSVTIPNGYTVQSVKSTIAYMFKDYSSYSFNDVLLTSPVGTKDLYCNDTDINLIKQGVAPCLQIFQITEIQSQGSYKGFYLSSRTSQTVSSTFNMYEDSVLNSTYSGSAYFLRYRALSSSSTTASNIANSLYPLQFRRYDSQDVLIGYYFSVPQTLWKFQNGTFSWLGDSTNWSDLSYYYKGIAMRIHCVS